MIPGLRNANFEKYGVMHRNTYINSPEILDNTFNLKGTNIFFAGQISGVEGYVESIASGFTVGVNIANKILNKEEIIFPEETVIGALAKYISTPKEDFQPMNANFGILPNLEVKIRDKIERYTKLAEKSINRTKQIM